MSRARRRALMVGWYASESGREGDWPAGRRPRWQPPSRRQCGVVDGGNAWVQTRFGRVEPTGTLTKPIASAGSGAYDGETASDPAKRVVGLRDSNRRPADYEDVSCPFRCDFVC